MMYIFTLTALLTFAFSTQALTPKQYCETLEAKKAESFEILNGGPVSSSLDTGGVGGKGTTIYVIKACHRGSFCITTAPNPIVLNCGKMLKNQSGQRLCDSASVIQADIYDITQVCN